MTQEELKRILDYDTSTGDLTWKVNVRGLKGKKAGGPRKCSRGGTYWRVAVSGKKYAAHRLIWFMVTGAWPSAQIDHRDGNGLNNAWANLRLATNSQNKANTGLYKNSTTGLKGVSVERTTGKFLAQIQKDGQKVYLGLFPSPQQAHEAYLQAAKHLFGEFARA
jgi:hypothetical protein